MNILVICQYYDPEPFRISDICEALVKRGHRVTVVTGLPNYPMGEIYEGYRHGKKREEVINGVHVHRCFTIGRKSGALYRFLNYYSYAVSSTRYVSKFSDEFDVVFVNQLSPVMMANAGIRYKKKHHKKLVLYCLDLWPESLTVGGIKRGSAVYQLFHRVSEKVYRQADLIFIASQSFAAYFKDEFGIENTKYLPQYAEPLFTPEQCQKKPDEFIDLMFAGNIGAAQRVNVLIEAARLTKDIENLRWHIVGDGSELEHVKRLAAEYRLTSVVFHGRQPLREMPRYYAMADAMLVSMQKDRVLSLTLPGKVQTYMAAGKPILGAIDGETRFVIERSACGLCVGAEDVEQFANCVRRFISDQAERKSFAENAAAYYTKHFLKSDFMNSIENQLGKMKA